MAKDVFGLLTEMNKKIEMMSDKPESQLDRGESIRGGGGLATLSTLSG